MACRSPDLGRVPPLCVILCPYGIERIRLLSMSWRKRYEDIVTQCACVYSLEEHLQQLKDETSAKDEAEEDYRTHVVSPPYTLLHAPSPTYLLQVVSLVQKGKRTDPRLANRRLLRPLLLNPNRLRTPHLLLLRLCEAHIRLSLLGCLRLFLH